MSRDSHLQLDLLISLESISLVATGCNLNFNKLASVKADIEKVSSFLSISFNQVVLFACIAELGFRRTVTPDYLAKHFQCSVLRFLSFVHEIETLENKGYVRKAIKGRGKTLSYRDMGFSIPHYIIEAIRKEDAKMLVSETKFDLPGFLRQMSAIVDERKERALSTAQVLAETEFLISGNKDLPFVSQIDEILEHTISKCTAFVFSYCRLKGQTAGMIDSFADTLFDDMSEQLEFCQQVSSGNHELIRKNILKIVFSDFDGEKMVSLTQNIQKKLYHNYPDLLIADPESRAGLVPHKEIKEKILFFNEDIRGKIKALEKVLNRSKFRSYTRELHQNRLSGGFTAIFYGAPGTGKTETVYQIARRTGRDIMMVDLSQIRSKWFGDSEKTVKKIFDDYAALLKSRDVEPILFINEADGLFSKRLDLGSRGTSTDQTMNTIQNILLQALENFEGILIATSNLTGNIDKAFERRLSFKIDFPLPDKHTRQKIWLKKLPDFKPHEAAELADSFELSGGEIDVHVRQVILQKVINKKTDLFEALMESCRSNHGFSSRRRVGF